MKIRFVEWNYDKAGKRGQIVARCLISYIRHSFKHSSSKDESCVIDELSSSNKFLQGWKSEKGGLRWEEDLVAIFFETFWGRWPKRLVIFLFILPCNPHTAFLAHMRTFFIGFGLFSHNMCRSFSSRHPSFPCPDLPSLQNGRIHKRNGWNILKNDDPITCRP